MRVPGHRLEAHGAPYTAHSCQHWPCDTLPGVQRVTKLGDPGDIGVGGHGHALCQCGWTSDHLLTGADRQRAHAKHKHGIAAPAAA